MKKIGIVTFFPNNNYGCLLQAFSLQNYLCEIGYDAEVISFEPNWKYFINRKIYRDIFHTVYAIYLYWKRHFSLKKWYMPNIKASETYSFISDIDAEKYDVLIAGSDQIWHPGCFTQQNGGADFFFLHFGRASAKRIAYAPSLSVLQWPDSFANFVKPYLEKFSSISVRELSAKKYLERLGLEDVSCVCDPTILHDASFYQKKFSVSLDDRLCKPFVFLIREILPEDFMNQISVNAFYLRIKKMKHVLSISQWLSHIYNAEYVITDSFHCLVFCLLFHKSFLVLKNNTNLSQMNERFVSLLGFVGLTPRLIDGKDVEKIRPLLASKIDWNRVDSMLDNFRSESQTWLKDALEKEEDA